MEKTPDTKIQNQHRKEIRSSTLILGFDRKEDRKRGAMRKEGGGDMK